MTNHENGEANRMLKFLVNYAQYGLIGAVIIVYSILSPVFISTSNIRELLAISSPLLVCAVGMTFVLLIAEIDLSVGSIAGVSGALWVVCVVNYGMSVAAGAAIGVLGGVVMGAANAFLVVKLKINSFLVTLGTQVFGRGLIFFIASGEQILTTDEMKRMVYQDAFGGIPILVVLSVGIAIVMALVYKYTSFGRRLQAVGCDRAAAAKIGVAVDRVRFSVFIIAGFFAAIAGLMQVGNIGMLNPVYVGNNMEFLAITAAVLGGASLFGGVGTIVPGTLIGVIFTMSIENGLGILGANPYIYPVVRGSVIYLAMFTDSLKRSIGIGMDK
jgi:ribose transport system permease protein